VAKRGQFVRFLRGICPRKNIPPKYNAASGIIAGELLKGHPIYVNMKQGELVNRGNN
jgi:hypothetical protein